MRRATPQARKGTRPLCGICGIACADPEERPARAVIERMAGALAHRGPDDAGVYIGAGIGLGHRRLSVIDLATGQQPMRHEGRDLTVTYNGEIYNFPELRAELLSRGVEFQTHSDTEVLLHGYAEWGMGPLLARLAGMFAFALWDGAERRLYLVRDRLGVKPLYWTAGGDGSLLFASELNAIRAVPGVDPALNAASLLGYLSTGYVIGEHAIVEGVQRLEAGCYLVWRPGAGARKETYWNLAEIWTAAAQRPPIDGRERGGQFSTLLDQAVSQRLLSEVPLGAFLSGGLDSSVICARIMKHRDSLETFSMGFQEKSYSELPWASLVAGELGTQHTEALVTCEDPTLLLEVAGRLDEPFADTSILPTYVMCRAARSRLTVALSGDGGDELLAGYTTHAADRAHGAVSALPAPLLALAERAAGLLPDSRRKVGAVFKLKQFLAGSRLDTCDAHAWWRMLLRREALKGLVVPGAWDEGFDPFAPFRAAYDAVPALNPLDRMLYVDYKTWLVDDILVKVDRASMAHGLEVRSPFLDHRLVEFCAGLPPHLKLSGFRGKKMLRDAARGQVPARVIARKKAGFNAPVSHWIAGPWRELVQDTLRSNADTGHFDRKALRALLDAHMAGQRDHGYLLFAILMFVLWQRR